MFSGILMVCTGNICRSPLAEAEMRKIAPGFKVSSAGISALEGKPPHPRALQLASDNGLDLSSHIARQIDDHLIRSHELILSMDSMQRKWIVNNYPQIRGRVFLLNQWGKQQDIPDPYGQSAFIFEIAYELIKRGCHAWKKKLDL